MQQSKTVWLIVGAVLILSGLSWYYFGSRIVTVPILQDQATTTATSAKTTTTPRTSVTPPPPPPSTTGITVSYTSSGFSPRSLEIKAGKAVTFINNSSGSMRIVSAQVPSLPGQPNPGFDQTKSVGRGGTFTYVFTIAGEWGYRNLNKPEQTGTIVVTP